MEQVCENAVPVGEENSTETKFLYIILKLKQAVPLFLKKGPHFVWPSWEEYVRLRHSFTLNLIIQLASIT